MTSSESTRLTAELELESRATLIKYECLGRVHLSIWESEKLWPQKWVCIVERSNGECYSSSRDLQGFRQLIADACPNLEFVGPFHKWFAMVGPQDYVVLTKEYYGKLFKESLVFHDPEQRGKFFEFFCESLTNSEYFRFRVSDESEVFVDNVDS